MKFQVDSHVSELGERMKVAVTYQDRNTAGELAEARE